MKDSQERVLYEKFVSLIALGTKEKCSYYINVPNEVIYLISKLYNVNLRELIFDLKKRGLQFTCKMRLIQEDDTVKIIVELPRPEEIAVPQVR